MSSRNTTFLVIIPLLFSLTISINCDNPIEENPEDVIRKNPPIEIEGEDGRCYHPAWSPDGRWIIYDKRMNPDETPYIHDIFKIDFNNPGSGPVNLSNNDYYDTGGVFHPNGEYIYFISNRIGGMNNDIYRMNSQGSDVELVVTGGGMEGRPWVDKNGEYLVFDSDRLSDNDHCNIWIKDITSPNGEYSKVTGMPGWELMPAFSPDNSDLITFAYDSDSYDDSQDIYIVPVAGGEPAAVIEWPSNDRHPEFGPTNDWLIFFSDLYNEPGLYDIIAYRISDGRHFRLTDSAGDDRRPSYNAATNKIAFDSDRCGNDERHIYTINWPF